MTFKSVYGPKMNRPSVFDRPGLKSQLGSGLDKMSAEDADKFVKNIATKYGSDGIIAIEDAAFRARYTFKVKDGAPVPEKKVEAVEEPISQPEEPRESPMSQALRLRAEKIKAELDKSHE